MIQVLQKYNQSVWNYVSLNLYDTYAGKFTLDQGFRPLFTIKSQQTGSVKNFMPVTAVLTNKDRYVSMVFITASTENLEYGVMMLGNDDFPYGFYDVTIRANVSNSNLDPDSASAKLYTGLMYLKESANPNVEYTQYDDNDSDTMSVYITNNIN